MPSPPPPSSSNPKTPWGALTGLSDRFTAQEAFMWSLADSRQGLNRLVWFPLFRSFERQREEATLDYKRCTPRSETLPCLISQAQRQTEPSLNTFTIDPHFQSRDGGCILLTGSPSMTSPLVLRITMTSWAWKVMISTGPCSIIFPMASWRHTIKTHY